jgi:uncharacterized Zn-binding protein involved in type VI secretion
MFIKGKPSLWLLMIGWFCLDIGLFSGPVYGKDLDPQKRLDQCAEIQRLSGELGSVTANLPRGPKLNWDWGRKAYHPPLQSHLSRFSKVNGISLKILSLMDELHTAGPEEQIPDCNLTAHITFCRKATISFSAKGLIDREDARIEYKMTGRAPAIQITDFTVGVTPIEIFGHGFAIISENPYVTFASSHVEMSGHYTYFGERFKATEFASFAGPYIYMVVKNISQEKPYFPTLYTLTVHQPNVVFYSKKGHIEGGVVRCLDYRWRPIHLTPQDLQEAFEKGRLTLRRKTEKESLSGEVTIDFAPPDLELQAPNQSVSGGIGLWGDRTTHGGFLLATGKEVFSDGHAVAREGDPVLCPIHGLSKVSRDESSGVYIGDKTVAFAGGKADCGAKILSKSPLTLVQPVKK